MNDMKGSERDRSQSANLHPRCRD